MCSPSPVWISSNERALRWQPGSRELPAASHGRRSAKSCARNLQHVKFAYALRQYLLDVDDETEELFREAIRKLKHAGAELVEIDLGVDFLALTARVPFGPPSGFFVSTASTRPQSSTLRATTPIVWRAWDIGATPSFGQRPGVGLYPTTPHNEAGTRIDPTV
jgi:Asp-tRNA(Asn)/Glu-tRNA(Gln) amidotransferase A subunit family amidase